MAITEIALLHLSPNTSANDKTLRPKLAHAKTVMQDFTQRTFYFMQQVEDPTFLYVIGEWDSLDQHMKDFIPGPENQAVLQSLKDEVTVDWLLHIDVAHASLPLPKTDAERTRTIRGGVTYSIVRHFVKSNQEAKFKQTFEANKHFLQEEVTQGTVGGGWRVDKEEGKEEFVLVYPWESIEEHLRFAETEGFAKYAQIRDHIDEAEIKHARIIDV